MEVKILPRVFRIETDDSDKPLNLPDPSEKLSVKEVIEHYSNQYPELTNCSIKETKIENDQQIIIISNKKGQHA